MGGAFRRGERDGESVVEAFAQRPQRDLGGRELPPRRTLCNLQWGEKESLLALSLIQNLVLNNLFAGAKSILTSISHVQPFENSIRP